MTNAEMVGTQAASAKRLRWWQVIVIIALVLFGIFELLSFFQEPEAQAVALGYFACGGTTLATWLARSRLRRWGRSSAPGAGFRFVLLGSLGAAWVEVAFWAAEKITGAVGVAASPNLILDLLVTMPWYISMVAVLWFVHRRYRYHWTTVALLGGLYEIGGDGIVGHSLSGNPFTPGYLVALVLAYFWVFVIVYAPIVLPPVWALPLDSEPYTGPRWRKAVGALLPLLPLVPFWLVLNAIFS
jgi:hypothetical protein